MRFITAKKIHDGLYYNILKYEKRYFYLVKNERLIGGAHSEACCKNSRRMAEILALTLIKPTSAG